jgi:hypothetical protein
MLSSFWAFYQKTDKKHFEVKKEDIQEFINELLKPTTLKNPLPENSTQFVLFTGFERRGGYHH